MCFKVPEVKVPDAPPVPSADSEEARARRAKEVDAARRQRGRAATILNTPLGDPSYGQSIRRTQLGGF